MHLGLEPVIILGADIFATQTTGVLELHTTLLIEPVLQSDREVGLIPAIHFGVTIKGLTTGYDVEGIDHRDADGGITTTRAHVAILTSEPFCTDTGRTGFLIFGR